MQLCVIIDYIEIDYIELLATRDPLANFTSTWAMTDTHLFLTRESTKTIYTDGHGWGPNNREFQLYRVRLDDITQLQRIDFRSEGGSVEIVGINEQYIFVSRRSNNASENWLMFQHDTYRICLVTLEAVLIDTGEYSGIPRYHAPTNSILFSHAVFSHWDLNGRVQRWRFSLESLCLDTGERHFFYEFTSLNSEAGTGWWLMENDAAVFINIAWLGISHAADFVLIEPNLQARQVTSHQVGYVWPPLLPTPVTPADEFIYGLGVYALSRSVTVGEWVFHLSSEHDWRVGGSLLYRINIDGTQNTLLRDDLEFLRLYSFNDSGLLFATIHVELEMGSVAGWYDAVILSKDGEIQKVLGGGWAGFNSDFGIQRLADTDLIVMMQFGSNWVDEHIFALYCLVTGVSQIIEERPWQ